MWAWAAAASLLGYFSLDFMHRRASAAGGGSVPNFEPTACKLYSTDTGDSKLCRAVVGALGKDQPVLYAATAIR